MRRFVRIAAVILFAFAPVALADSIQFTVSSSVLVAGSSPSDNWWGEYRTAPDALGTQSSVLASVPFALAETTFSNISFFLPVGSVVTSATMNLILPIGPITGTGTVFTSQLLPPLGFSGVHIAPTFNDPGTSIFFLNYVTLGPPSPYAGTFPNSPIINGNEVSTGTLDLYFELGGEIIGTINTPGYNWDSYIEGYGQATLPYSVQVDVNYTPVPEPSSFVLLGTGLIVCIEVVRQRRTA